MMLAAAPRRIEVRGIYSNPRPFWEAGGRLEEYGVNAVFTGASSITSAMIERAAREGARVYAEFPTLNGKGYVEQHPEAWPVNERGERAAAATWFLGACPTEPGFRAYRMQQLEELLERHDVAGVWMDYFHWHAQFEDPNPVLPETCFCGACLEAFERWSGVRGRAERILSGEEKKWREWRVEQLLGWAREIGTRLKKQRPGAMLGVFHCPWTDEEFGGARRRILGLDLKRLAEVVDVFSPMVYHGRMERRPEWVGENVRWLAGQVGWKAKVWPIVQAADGPKPVSAEEFERVLRWGGSGGASGVMMFTAQAVAGSAEKMAVMRRVYGEWAKG